MYEWIHDDITWCGDECNNLSCERNLANKLNKDGLFSMAMFRNTPTCPLYKQSGPRRFKKKPVIIEAIQWTGNNIEEIERFAPRIITVNKNQADELCIDTLEGVMTASKEDWIIRGVQGEYYPCKPDIFEETYEAVEE